MSLQDKAIDIKGKKYILVSDRVLEFHNLYPKGSITTELVSGVLDDQVIVKATVKPDFEAERVFTAYSQGIKGEGMVNKVACLENVETSAVGRALGFLGIGIIEGIASADEMKKAEITDQTLGDQFQCEDCQAFVTPKVKTFSVSKYKKVLCMSCQKKVDFLSDLPLPPK